MLDVRVSAFAEAAQQAKRMDDKATHALDQVRGARTAITAGTKGMWSFTATKALCDTQLEMEGVKETAHMLATMYESVNDTLVNGLVPSYRAVLEPLGIEPPADHVFFDPSYDVEARMSECDDAGRALSAAAASISDALVGLDGADGIKSCLTNCLNPPDRYFEPIYISKTKNPYRTTKERDRDIRDQMEEFKNIVERFRHGRLPIPPSNVDKARHERLKQYQDSQPVCFGPLLLTLSPLSTSGLRTGVLTAGLATGSGNAGGTTHQDEESDSRSGNAKVSHQPDEESESESAAEGAKFSHHPKLDNGWVPFPYGKEPPALSPWDEFCNFINGLFFSEKRKHIHRGCF